MPQGFFKSSTLVNKPPSSSIMKCGACGLYKNCLTPKMAYSGEGRRGVLILGEAPGRVEDERGLAFVGKAGQLLRDHLRSQGVEMRKDCWLENANICRPGNNRTPTKNEVEYCRPHVLGTIDEVKPKVIVPLGGTAVRSLLGAIWKEDPGSITKWAGWRIPCQSLNTWICPTYHPSYLERSKRPEFPDGNPVLVKMFGDHLKQAFELQDKPFAELPDYRSQIECIANTREAARKLRWMLNRGGRIAFDYETNKLKPEGNGTIVCCSVCWEGKKTIAYPWQGETIEATGALLKSKLPKIGWNIKFEERWTRKEFGHGVRNWAWDGMLATHTLDSRPGICSAKFQAFVQLGIEPYNKHIEQFLKAKKGSDVNQILEEIDLHDLLYYCGLDSLLEFQIAEKQMAMMDE